MPLLSYYFIYAGSLILYYPNFGKLYDDFFYIMLSEAADVGFMHQVPLCGDTI
jgi:hypothetical protein